MTPDPGIFLTTKEAAAFLGVKPNAMHKWRYKHEGPPVYRVGDGPKARCFYLASEIEEWLAGKRVVPKPTHQEEEPMTTSNKPAPCVGCGAPVPTSGSIVHAIDCPAWEASIGPYSTPVIPPRQKMPRGVKEGWICPSCGAGIAPWMPYCSFCKPLKEEK